MKLKSGCIFWSQNDPGPEPLSSKLSRDVQCEVAIIGAGITGALTAYHLTREGIHTVVVDRRHAGHGSTAASTGLLQYEIDMPLVDLIGKVGRDRAVASYRASAESVAALESLILDLGDKCGLRGRPSLYLASEEKDVDHLRNECDARRAIQIDVMFLGREALREEFDLARPAALWSSLAAEVDPFRLTRQLFRRSLERGVELFSETEIVRCESHSGGVTLHTDGGAKIEAKIVVFAMGYETMGMVPSGLCRLASTYALCSEPVRDLSSWRDECLIWETARPYLYARTTEDGRVIVGGEDEDVVDPHERDQMIERKAQTLCDRFSSLFPRIKIDTTCAWAGTFAETKDGLPYIGTLPEYPNCYFTLGYGGNGITFSLIAAEIVRDLFLGRPNRKAALFGFDR
jgi:glycine/D-amino acid oxidase-like deaminating enzyme